MVRNNNWKGGYCRNVIPAVLSLILSCQSCTVDTAQVNHGILQPLKCSEVVPLHRLLHSIEYIPLNEQDVLLGSIYPILKIKNQFLIQDYNSSKLYFFNNNGKFIEKICCIGEGQNEYKRISSVSFDSQKDLLYMADRERSMIHEYSFRTEKIERSHKLPVIPMSLLVKDSILFLLEQDGFGALKSYDSKNYAEKNTFIQNEEILNLLPSPNPFIAWIFRSILTPQIRRRKVHKSRIGDEVHLTIRRMLTHHRLKR